MKRNLRVVDIKVSVIITTYNMESYIKCCIDSVLEQTLDGIEVIVIDDGSTDKTKNVIEQNYSLYDNLHYVYKENAGAGVARNMAIDIARGEYLLFMDADDKYPSTDCVEKLYATAKDNGAKICGGNIIIFDGSNEKEEYKAGMGNIKHTVNGFIDSVDFFYLFGHTRYIYQRQMIIDNNIRYLSCRRFEDQTFIIRSLAAAQKLYELDYPVYWCRRSEIKSVSRDSWIETFRGYRDTIKVLIDCNMRLMFAENIKNILSSFASRWQLMGFVNDPEVTMIAEEIERVLRKNDWTNDSLKGLIDIAADVDRRVRLIPADKKIIIYGVGKNTISFMNEYEEYLQDRIVGMAVTQKNSDNSLFAGKYPVKRIEDYVDEKNEVVVLVTPSGNNKKEIIAKLTDLGFSNIIDVEIVSR